MLIVAIADVRGDTVLQGNDARGALAASAGPGTLSLVSSAQIADGRVSARLSVPNASVMASLEVHDTTRREVGRLRKGLSTLTASDDRGTILSDIFFYEDPRPTDASLDDVLGRGVGRAEVARRARIGAFWELTREQPASDSVTLTLTVLPRDGGWLRRLAVRVGIGEAQAPVHMRFVEPIGDSRVTSRALALDFSALPAGRYDVRLRMETARGEHGESTREIRIR